MDPQAEETASRNIRGEGRMSWLLSPFSKFLVISGLLPNQSLPHTPAPQGWASPQAVPGQVRSASTDIYRHVQSAQSYVLYLHKMLSMK